MWRSGKWSAKTAIFHCLSSWFRVCCERLPSDRRFCRRHLGLYKPSAIPTARGFDEQYGYYLGGEDYWTHCRAGGSPSVDGLDWHRNGTLETAENGTYSADLLGRAAVDFIHRRAAPTAELGRGATMSAAAGPAARAPWYLYLPFQSVHSPLEAPAQDLARYPALTGTVQTRAAMISAMDRAVGALAAALKTTGQYDKDLVRLPESGEGRRERRGERERERERESAEIWVR